MEHLLWLITTTTITTENDDDDHHHHSRLLFKCQLYTTVTLQLQVNGHETYI